MENHSKPCKKLMWYPVKSIVVRVILTVVFFAVAGIAIGKWIVNEWPSVKTQLFSPASLYQTDDIALIKTVNAQPIQRIGWQNLLPDKEKDILEYYQNSPDGSFSDQMLRSLEACTDQAYQSALYSSNIVNELVGRAVALSGFIVPVDVDNHRSIKSFFLVPYFGACLHFPPPPPNQMLFVRLDKPFSLENIDTPVTVTGILQRGLFEDPLGTSAYIMQVARIDSFHGEPDDFRRHPGN